MHSFGLLFFIFVSSFADWEVVQIWDTPGCTGNAIYWAVAPLGLSCSSLSTVPVCTSLTGFPWSTLSRCSSTTNLSFPATCTGWATFADGTCTGTPTALIGYGKGCIDLTPLLAYGGSSIKESYQASCASGGGIRYDAYVGSSSCQTGSGVLHVGATYNFGCHGYGPVSIAQVACTSRAKVWGTITENWLKSATFSFGALSSATYTTTTSGTTVSIHVTLTVGQTTTEIDALVSEVCSDLQNQVNGGICTASQNQYNCVFQEPFSPTCSWKVVVRSGPKRASEQVVSTFVITGDNSGVSSLSGFFAIALALFVAYLH